MGVYIKETIKQIAFITKMTSDSILFLLLLIRIVTISKIGVFSRTQLKWTNLFFIKLIISILLTLNYGSISISINPIQSPKPMISNVLSSIVWLFASVLLYFEYLRQLNQSWLSLRLLYLIHFLIYASKVTLQIIYESNYIHLYSTVLFGLLSLPMLIFSIAFPHNSLPGDKSTSSSFIPALDEITSNFLQSDGNNSSNVNNGSTTLRNIIEISITETKLNTYHQKGDYLIPLALQKHSIDSNDIKLKFIVKIMIPNAHNNAEEKYHHSKKKTIKSIMKFNQKCLADLEKEKDRDREQGKDNEKDSRSSIIRSAYLMYHSEIAQAIQLLSNALTQKDGLNASMYLKEKFPLLEAHYTKLCKWKTFLIDLLSFLGFDNKEIIENINHEYNPQNDLLNMPNELNSISFISLRDSVDENNLLIKDDQGTIDINSIMSQITLSEILFINDVITRTNYMTLTIEDDYYINECIKCRIKTESVSFTIPIPIQQLFNYINQLSSTSSSNAKTSKGKSASRTKTKANQILLILTQEKSLGQIVKGEMPKEMKLNIEKLLSSILNDLFYLNESSYELFNLNKIIKSITGTSSIIQYIPKVFFDSKVIEMFPFEPQVYDLRKFDIESEIEQVLTIGTTSECESLVIIFNLIAKHKDHKCIWKAEVNLFELYGVISEITEMALTYPRLLSQLAILLTQLKQLLNTLDISSSNEDNKTKHRIGRIGNNAKLNQSSQSTSFALDSNPNKQKMCYDLSTSINALFSLDKREVLYSSNFRQLFSFDKIITSKNVFNAENESLNCSMNSLL